MVPGPRLTVGLALMASLLSLVAVGAALAGTPSASGARALVLEGSVVVIRGNQLPGPRRIEPSPASACTVIAVAGAVMPLQPGQALLPARALKAPILARVRCNRQGRFRLTLPDPARWPIRLAGTPRLTLMLEVPGGYYLNHFDGEGQFVALGLPLASDRAPITLRDDRDAVQ